MREKNASPWPGIEPRTLRVVGQSPIAISYSGRLVGYFTGSRDPVKEPKRV